MNIVKRKNWFFIISAILIVPGLISLLVFGLKPAIDFTGGSVLELSVKSLSVQQIEEEFLKEKIETHSVNINEGNAIIRTTPLEQKVKNKVVGALKNRDKSLTERSFETVGPSIGRETTANAFKAVAIASIAISLYVAFAFRKVSKPVASWKYGICVIITLLHDALLVVGVFSILGLIANVEVDALFITALLTVMGFSVHDTIVVFDRIRENQLKNFDHSFEEVVNRSLLETMNRSINTSITIILVLFSLILFGGESIRWFTAALLIGIISGTYSSIFNAAPLLVVWYEWDKRKKIKEPQV